MTNNKEQIIRTEIIDIEPSWESVLTMVMRSSDNPKLAEMLRPIAKMSDQIRQAQKRGAKGVSIYFNKDGSLTFTDFIGDD